MQQKNMHNSIKKLFKIAELNYHILWTPPCCIFQVLVNQWRPWI